MNMRNLVVFALVCGAVPSCDLLAEDGQGAVTLTSASHALGILEPGQQADSRSFLVDAAAAVAFTVASAKALAVEVITPEGIHLTEQTAVGEKTVQFLRFTADEAPKLPFPGIGKGENTMVLLNSPEPGQYEIRVDAGTPVSSASLFVITLSLVSDLQVGVVVPEREIIVGMPVAIAALAYDRTSPVTDATVNASVTTKPNPGDPLPVPHKVPLLDNGLDADAAVGDGIYTGVFLPSAPGRYAVAVRFGGRTASGLPFERYATAAFVASERTSSLGGSCIATGIDDDGNGLFERLRIGVALNIAASGEFNLEATLRALNGQTIATNRVGQFNAGSQVVDLDFDAAEVRSLGVDGPFTISSIRLDELTASTSVLQDSASDPATTPAYRLKDFERGAIELTGTASAVGLDDDKDGLIDRVRALVGVDVLSSGTYTWSARIADPQGTDLGVATGAGKLGAGQGTIELIFDGCPIGAKGLEGPYAIEHLVLSGTDSVFGPLSTLMKVDLPLSQFSCRADSTPPETTYSLTPPPNAEGWNRANVVVTLSATDNPSGAGVREIHESFSGSQSSSGIDPQNTSQVTITAEGTTTLSYFAVDNAGNVEGPQTLSVKIDKTPPVIECPANVWLLYPVTTAMIGAARATDALDPAPVVKSDSPALLALGANVVTWTATDTAGNTSTCKQSVTVLDPIVGNVEGRKRP